MSDEDKLIYDFTPDPPPQPEEFVMNEPHATLVRLAEEWGCKSLKTGRVNPILQQAAIFQAENQSSRGAMGHQQWPERSKELFTLLPDYTNFREVCAVSNVHQTEPADGALGAMTNWRNSKTHWDWINGACSAWGYAMTYNERMKIWFATGILADRK